jgi:hypothetical protein
MSVRVRPPAPQPSNPTGISTSGGTVSKPSPLRCIPESNQAINFASQDPIPNKIAAPLTYVSLSTETSLSARATAYEADMRLAEECGEQSFLAKPVAPDMLVAEVVRLTSQNLDATPPRFHLKNWRNLTDPFVGTQYFFAAAHSFFPVNPKGIHRKHP